MTEPVLGSLPTPRTCTILVVEDDADCMRVLVECLHGVGFRVLVARDGDSALEKVQYGRPDLVLLDMLLPGRDGVEICRLLKESAREIPVVFMTALSGVQDKVRAFQAGAVDYVTKPFQYDELVARVSTHVALARMRKELASQNARLQEEVAERVRVEEALRLLQADLERRVEARTAELTRANELLSQEIAGRRQVEAHLSCSEEEARRLADFQRAILDHAACMVISTDLEGTVTSFNKAAERLLGYSEAEAVGALNVCRLFKVEDLEERARSLSGMLGLAIRPDFEALVTLAKRSQLDETEYSMVRKDGSHFPALLSVTSLRDGRGEIQGFLGVVYDLTDRKGLEAGLRQAQKMEAFGQLAGGVAHDFNNILTVISGYGSMLELQPLPPSARRAVANISEAAERAANLTRQLLTFSRRRPVEFRALSLDSIVTGTSQMLRRLIGEHISVEYRFSAGEALVRADPGLLEQVLINLVLNARDAMPSGGRIVIETDRVSVEEEDGSARPERRPGQYVRLSVHDSGCGIPADHIAHIFEPFFTTKEMGKGTGLGLAVVYGHRRTARGLDRGEQRGGARGARFTSTCPLLVYRWSP